MAADLAMTIRRAAVEVGARTAFFLARRVPFRPHLGGAAERPAAGVELAAVESGAREALVRAIQDCIDDSSRHPGPLSLVIVSPSLPIDVTAAVRSASVEHVGSVIDRVTRSSDFWGALGNGRFAVVLDQCDEPQAAAYASRLAVAVANRPLIAAGARVVVEAAAVPSTCHGGQSTDAATFLAEAERRAGPGSLPVHRLLADTRLLRSRLVSQEYAARAA